MKTALLPRIKKLIINTNLLSVRVNGLICLGKLLPFLDKWLVIDEILPMLQQVPSREPAVIMATIGIYKLTLTDAKLGMTKEVMATKVLPYLFPLSIENGLSVSQYTAVMALIRDLIDRVEAEHRVKLEQLSSIQNEQRSALQISMSETAQMKSDQLVPSTSKGTQGELDDVFSGLGLGSYVSKKDTGAIATSMMSNNTNHVPQQQHPVGGPGGGNKPLSLADKQRLLKESETASKIGQQAQLKPTSMSGMGKTSTSRQTKDLTSSLMESNLNQMKHSQTMSSIGSTSTTSGAFGAQPQFGMMASSQPSWGQPQQQQQPQLSMWGQPMLQMQPPQPQQQSQQPKPDLSAFDSLMPSSSTRPAKQSMNSMMGTTSTSSNMGMMMNMNSTGGLMQPQSQQPQYGKPPVKSLTANDISDFLS